MLSLVIRAVKPPFACDTAALQHDGALLTYPHISSNHDALQQHMPTAQPYSC